MVVADELGGCFMEKVFAPIGDFFMNAGDDAPLLVPVVAPLNAPG